MNIFFTNWCLLGLDSILCNKQNCLSSFCSSVQDERCCWLNLKCCKSVPSEKEVMYLSIWLAVIATIWFMRICYLLFKQYQPLFSNYWGWLWVAMESSTGSGILFCTNWSVQLQKRKLKRTDNSFISLSSLERSHFEKIILRELSSIW